jgi:hypothetical protein
MCSPVTSNGDRALPDKWKIARAAISKQIQLSIVNLHSVCSIIPSSPACDVYISQMMGYTQASSTYDYFFNGGRLLTNKLMLQGSLQSRLQAAFRKFYGRYNDLVCKFKFSLGQKLSDVFHDNC